MSEARKQVTIYTDGGCEPNPGRGGYGVVLLYGTARKELSGGFRLTTNNRMEIFAAITALEALKEPCQVTLYSDSDYVVSAIAKGWAKRWQRNNWWRTKDERAANPDLWERLLALCGKHQVEFVWVKGHAGNPENERCDQLSVVALAQPELPPDAGYEDPPATSERPQVTQEGQPCPKCSTPLVKRRPHKAIKPELGYYFEYYLLCPACQATFTVEAAKRLIGGSTLFESPEQS